MSGSEFMSNRNMKNEYKTKLRRPTVDTGACVQRNECGEAPFLL
jgi:hypothetical protein